MSWQRYTYDTAVFFFCFVLFFCDSLNRDEIAYRMGFPKLCKKSCTWFFVRSVCEFRGHRFGPLTLIVPSRFCYTSYQRGGYYPLELENETQRYI